MKACMKVMIKKSVKPKTKKITVKNDEKLSNHDSILTINDYVKVIVLKFQSKYPDTELSKKLGISRKSLWEKRKKFGIEKKRANS